MVIRHSIDAIQFTDSFFFGFDGGTIARYPHLAAKKNKDYVAIVSRLKAVLQRVNVAIGRGSRPLPLSNHQEFMALLTAVGTACDAHRRGPLVTLWICLGMAVADLFDLVGDKVDIGVTVDANGEKLSKITDRIRELAGNAGVALDALRILKNHLDRLADELHRNLDLDAALQCCQSIREVLLGSADETDQLAKNALTDITISKLRAINPEQNVRQSILKAVEYAAHDGVSAGMIALALGDAGADKVRYWCERLKADGLIVHNGKKNKSSRWFVIECAPKLD
jgi:hypothetical protein